MINIEFRHSDEANAWVTDEIKFPERSMCVCRIFFKQKSRGKVVVKKRNKGKTKKVTVLKSRMDAEQYELTITNIDNEVKYVTIYTSDEPDIIECMGFFDQ